MNHCLERLIRWIINYWWRSIIKSWVCSESSGKAAACCGSPIAKNAGQFTPSGLVGPAGTTTRPQQQPTQTQPTSRQTNPSKPNPPNQPNKPNQLKPTSQPNQQRACSWALSGWEFPAGQVRSHHHVQPLPTCLGTQAGLVVPAVVLKQRAQGRTCRDNLDNQLMTNKLQSWVIWSTVKLASCYSQTASNVKHVYGQLNIYG